MNHALKISVHSGQLPVTTEDISHKIQSFMRKLQHHPSRVSSFFRHPANFYLCLPHVTGMLHQADFKDFFTSGCQTITDLWGVERNVRIWRNYWIAFWKYRHVLYITQASKEKPDRFTTLNYQFLNTVSMTADEFRPQDLPLGWRDSPVFAKEWDSKAEQILKQYALGPLIVAGDNRYLSGDLLELLTLLMPRGKWYEPTFQQKRKAFFENVLKEEEPC